MIYAYGICEPAVASPMPRRRGLGGATLRVLERGGLAAVYSRHRTLRALPLPELVCAHERVVEAIMARGAVLPLRFGTQLEREEQLADVLAARRDELLESIERVRGKVELGIRMIPERREPLSPAEPGGRGYLLARVEANRRHQQAVREVHAVLAELSEASSTRQPPKPPAILVASYLVESERVAEFRRRAERVSQRQPGMQVLVTGPWPPYSFAPAEEHE